MARPDKAAAVAELTDAFRGSAAAVLTEYRGLSVSQLRELRRSLGDNASYAIVKNTLTKIAVKEAGVPVTDDLLTGPSAVAFVTGDPVEAARGLRDFSRANPLLVIKGGYLEGRALSSAEVARLADLESREVLLARLAGAMTASLSRAAALFQAPLSQAARVIEALRAAQGGADSAGDADSANTNSAAAEPAAADSAGDADSANTDSAAAEPAAADSA